MLTKEFKEFIGLLNENCLDVNHSDTRRTINSNWHFCYDITYWTHISEEMIKVTTNIAKNTKQTSEEIGKPDDHIAQAFDRLEARIEKCYTDLIKWMFIFWITQIAAQAGILFAFFK